MKEPLGGFTDPKLSSVFARQKPTSTSTSAPTSITPARKSGLSGAAVAGIVLGVIVLIGLICVGALVVLRRVRHKRKAAAGKATGAVQLYGDVEKMKHDPTGELPAGEVHVHELHSTVTYHELPSNEKGQELEGDSVHHEVVHPDSPASAVIAMQPKPVDDIGTARKD
jgi:hypothetical protein